MAGLFCELIYGAWHSFLPDEYRSKKVNIKPNIMKKLLMALAVAGLLSNTADAQSTKINACGVNKGKVCRTSGNNKHCYKTKFAENFKVCRNDNGYFICCESPNRRNSTYRSVATARAQQPYQPEYAANKNQNNSEVDLSIPQSQSYVGGTSNSYQGYYPQKGHIKVCYVGENVAENNRNPYQGCPSPQFEGPDVNAGRNINVSNPVSLPPVSGRAME